MSVLSRPALEASPLADLHAIASELGIDGFRRLRKSDLIDAILDRQGGEAGDSAEPDAAAEPEAEAEAEPEAEARPRRRRSPRTRGRAGEAEEVGAGEEAPRPRRSRARRAPGEEEAAAEGERIAEGVVEVQGNGSGFLRADPAGPSDDDVYLSGAQVRRCELVSGDRVSGPVRPPRRSERYASLVRVDAINGAPADEVSGSTPFDDLPAAWPAERIALDSEDPTLKAIEWLTPIGRGSRVTIVGAARAGKSEALRRLGAALAGRDGLEVSAVLAGVRPEEAAEWRAGPVEPAAALTFAASPRPSSAPSTRASASRRAAGTPSCSSTAWTG
jgi:transcription termination factor Rho